MHWLFVLKAAFGGHSFSLGGGGCFRGLSILYFKKLVVLLLIFDFLKTALPHVAVLSDRQA